MLLALAGLAALCWESGTWGRGETLTLLGALVTPDRWLLWLGILFILLVFVFINLAVDVLYAYIDPRIDYG